jgi:hypothetical protein
MTDEATRGPAAGEPHEALGRPSRDAPDGGSDERPTGKSEGSEGTPGEVPAGQSGEANLAGSQGGVATPAAATHFAQLCERPLVTEDNLWSFLGYEVSFDDLLQISLGGFWKLESRELLSNNVSTEDLELIPISAMQRARTRANNAVVTSMHGQREVVPVPFNSMAGMLLDHSDSWHNYLALPLSKEEYSASPVVKLSTIRPDRREKIKLRRLHRQLLPVGKIELRFDQPSPLGPIEIAAPDFATIEWVALDCKISVSSHVDEIRDCVTMAGGTSVQQTEILKAGVERVVNLLTGALGHVADHVDEAQRQARRIKRFPTIRRRSWSHNLRRIIAELQETWENCPRDSAGLKRQIDRLITLLQSASIEFSYCTKVTKNTNLEVALDRLDSVLGELTQFTSLKSLVIPFTTEKEPHNQPRSAGATLLVLAALMMVISFFTSNWPSNDSGNGLPELLNKLRPDSIEFTQLREPLVALLLIFPAALYARFFQARPRSGLGAGVQLNTFAALSLVFALPMIPAVLVATGWSLEVVSAACGLAALVAVIAGALVLRLFSQGSLGRLRRREATLAARPRPRRRGPDGRPHTRNISDERAGE